LLDTFYNTKHKYYKNINKKLCLKYSEAIRIIQEGCTANGVKCTANGVKCTANGIKKSDELENRYLSEKN
jgi:hypothetical protein